MWDGIQWRKVDRDFPNDVNITLGRIIENSNAKIGVGADAGKRIIERNLECMEKWTEDEVSEIFEGDEKVRFKLKNFGRGKSVKRKSLTENHPAARAAMVESTRKHMVKALEQIFKFEKRRDPGLRMPPRGQYMGIAMSFINEREIKNKEFNSGCVESIDRRKSNKELREAARRGLEFVGPFRGPYDSSDSEDDRDPLPLDSEDEMFYW